MKLYRVEGLRHHAIVIAESEDDAIKLAIKEYESEKEGKVPQVLFGSVGEWESPKAEELKLPKQYKIVKNEK
jgi:hypothetical protein